MTCPKATTYKGFVHIPWEYKDVGLDVPDGFTNRRRVWQILEDMDPKETDGLADDDIVLDDWIRNGMDDFNGYNLSDFEVLDGSDWGEVVGTTEW